MLFIALVAILRTRSGLARKHITLSRRAAIISVTMVYVFSIVWAAVWVLPEMGSIYLCMGEFGRKKIPQVPVLVYMSMNGIVFIVTFLSYAILTCHMRCKNRQNTSIMNKTEILTLKAGVSVSIIFIVSYLMPFVPRVVLFRQYVGPQNALHVIKLFVSLTYLQSALNPYVYMATNSNFRKIYWKTLCRTFCKTSRIHPSVPGDITVLMNSGNNLGNKRVQFANPVFTTKTQTLMIPSYGNSTENTGFSQSVSAQNNSVDNTCTDNNSVIIRENALDSDVNDSPNDTVHNNPKHNAHDNISNFNVCDPTRENALDNDNDSHKDNADDNVINNAQDSASDNACGNTNENAVDNDSVKNTP